MCIGIVTMYQTFRSHMIAPCSTLTKRASISPAIIATISAIERSAIMSSSLPKASSGDERQQGLDTVVDIGADTAKDTARDAVVDTVVDAAVDAVADTFEAVTVEELILHPAAAIFRDETLAGIGDENTALEDNNSRLRHLPYLSQKLDITFSTASSEVRDREIYITHHETMRLRTHLSHGNVELVDGNEKLVFPINDANAHPIDDCGTIGDISSNLAALPIGSFPSFSSHGVQNVEMRVEDDGSIYLTIHLSPLITIEGRLEAAISNDALAAHIERVNFIAIMQVPVPISVLHGSTQEKGIYFTPTSISLSLTPRIKKTLSFSSDTYSPSDSDEHLADKLRRTVVDALGESEHKELLRENLELKRESAALASIRHMMLGIDVSHSAGAFCVALDKSHKVKDCNKRAIILDGRDGSEDFPTSVPVEDMGSIGISFAGTQLRMNVFETMQYLLSELMPIFFYDDTCRSISFVLVGVFNWGDFSDDEMSDIFVDFEGKLRSVLEGNGEDVFPKRMTFRFNHMFCPHMTEGLLKTVGLLEEPDSDSDE